MQDEIFNLIKKEEEYQKNTLRLIASENYASKQVREAMSSMLTNKYAEGYPGKRYYGGNIFVDQIETIAIERAKHLFNAEHANVQPHSGSNANLAVFFALLNPGDSILAMDLTHGGHLTHGSKVNFSGKWFDAHFYGVEEGKINYEKVMEIAKKVKPKLIICGYTAYPFEINFKIFREIADEVGAYLLADISHIAGLVAGGVHERPKDADIVTFTTHKTLRGPRGAAIVCKDEYANKIDKAVFPGIQGGPLEHVIAAKAVCFNEALQPEFKEYAEQIVKNAKVLAKTLLGLGYELVGGGTENHLLLVDLRNKNISGKEAQIRLEHSGIITNRNTIPDDPKGPFTTSGLRLGTAAVTTRGMKEEEMEKIAELIDQALRGVDVFEEVKELCSAFPLE